MDAPFPKGNRRPLPVPPAEWERRCRQELERLQRVYQTPPMWPDSQTDWFLLSTPTKTQDDRDVALLDRMWEASP